MYKHKFILLAIGMCFLTMALKKAESRITVYTIGDSTMANKDTTNGNPERGWAMAFQPFFDAGKVVVENHAMNGRSTKSFRDEGRWKVITDKLKKGDYVFIQFGHNDEKIEDPSRYADAQGAYKANLKRYVEETRAKKAYPVLMTPIIRRTFDNNGVLVNTHDDYPDAVRALAEELNVPLIDMEKKTRHLIQSMGEEDSKSLFMWFPAGHSAAHPNGITDNTHLNGRGARLVAKEAVKGIREQNLPLAGCLAAGEQNLCMDDVEAVEGQIPIVAWYGLRHEPPTEEQYRDMADAGLTIYWFGDGHGNLPAEKFFSTLDAAQTAGVKVVVAIQVLDVFSDAEIARLKAHPALWGYSLYDEPPATMFAALDEQIKKAKEKDDTHPFYINLLPYYDKWPSMNDYLNDYFKPFIETVPVPFLSFDKYPIQQKGSNPRTIDSHFYALLEVVSDEAQKANLPFWAFALSVAHWDYPIPTLADLRLQVYSDLAYGAQCIQYFTYWTPAFNPDLKWHGAPLDTAGNKTPTYDVVKAMNAEIKALSKVFLGSKMVWAAHTDKVPQGCTAFNKSQLPAVFKDLEVSKGGVLVSLLERGKDNFLVVVNHDINEEAVVKVSTEASVRMIKKDGTVVAADGESHTLSPGDILVHFWKTKMSEP